MPSRLLLVSALALLPVLTEAAEGQASSPDPPVVSIGQRVRIFAARVSQERITGEVVGEDAASISIATAKGVAVVPRASVDLLEVSGGRGSRTKGFVRGALLGIGTLLAAGYLIFQDDFDLDWGALARSPATYVIAGVGGAIGGRVTSRETWKAVPSSGFRVSVTF